MIEINGGFTSITAGADEITTSPWLEARENRTPRQRAPTGARVTLEFSREEALPPNQSIRVRYEFGGGGPPHEVVGIAHLTHSDTRRGRAVVYHYRMSHWIAPQQLRPPVARAGQETSGDPIRA